MLQLKEILEKERERSTMEQCLVIHLFREGTFYRAYEWSAWLCLRYFTELKVTHRLLKGGKDIIFVGFPLTSLQRYTPEGASVVPLDDRDIEMTLPADVFSPVAECETLHDFKQYGFFDHKLRRFYYPFCSLQSFKSGHKTKVGGIFLEFMEKTDKNTCFNLEKTDKMCYFAQKKWTQGNQVLRPVCLWNWESLLIPHCLLLISPTCGSPGPSAVSAQTKWSWEA